MASGIAACTTAPRGINPGTPFEVERHLGTRYEIAWLDHAFERGPGPDRRHLWRLARTPVVSDELRCHFIRRAAGHWRSSLVCAAHLYNHASMEKLLVSACLLGEKVRYDGGDSAVHGLLDTWARQGRIVFLCPEMAGGLCVPRQPAEIEGGNADAVLRGMGRVQRKDGVDVTAAFMDGAERALAQCWEHKIKIAILKEGSPSCGSGMVNDGRFSGTKIGGQGVTTALLTGHGISVFNETQLDEAARRLAELEGR